jgi:hypothetical protein
MFCEPCVTPWPAPDWAMHWPGCVTVWVPLLGWDTACAPCVTVCAAPAWATFWLPWVTVWPDPDCAMDCPVKGLTTSAWPTATGPAANASNATLTGNPRTYRFNMFTRPGFFDGWTH